LNSKFQSKEEKGDVQTQLTEKQVGRKLKTSLVLPVSQGRAGIRYTALSPEPFPKRLSGTSGHFQAFPTLSAPALCYHFEAKRKRECMSPHREQLLVSYSFMYSQCLQINYTNTI